MCQSPSCLPHAGIGPAQQVLLAPVDLSCTRASKGIKGSPEIGSWVSRDLRQLYGEVSWANDNGGLTARAVAASPVPDDRFAISLIGRRYQEGRGGGEGVVRHDRFEDGAGERVFGR